MTLLFNWLSYCSADVQLPVGNIKKNTNLKPQCDCGGKSAKSGKAPDEKSAKSGKAPEGKSIESGKAPDGKSAVSEKASGGKSARHCKHRPVQLLYQHHFGHTCQ
jgi:hypothetical protein